MCMCAHTHAHTHTRRGSEVREQGLKSRSELKDKTLCSSPQAQTHLVSSTSLYLPGGLRPCIPCFFFKVSLYLLPNVFADQLEDIKSIWIAQIQHILCPRPLRWKDLAKEDIWISQTIFPKNHFELSHTITKPKQSGSLFLKASSAARDSDRKSVV